MRNTGNYRERGALNIFVVDRLVSILEVIFYKVNEKRRNVIIGKGGNKNVMVNKVKALDRSILRTQVLWEGLSSKDLRILE